MKKLTVFCLACFLFAGIRTFGFSQTENQDLSALLRKGIDLCLSGSYEEAISAFTQVLKLSVDPDINKQALLYLGYTYFALGDHSRAKSQVEEVIKVSPQMAVSEIEFGAEFSKFFEATKKELVGIAFIESVPDRAMIWIDRVKIDYTPLKIELLAKQYSLRAIKGGYSPYEETVLIRSDSMNPIKVDLTKEKNWKNFVTSSLIMVAVSVLVRSL
jgi:tetratricopeptide (TPR) repeat protein